MAPPGQPRTSQDEQRQWWTMCVKLRGGYLHVLGLRFALLQDPALSMVLTVAAAAINSELDVAASFWQTVAAAPHSGCGELARWGADSWKPHRVARLRAEPGSIRCSTSVSVQLEMSPHGVASQLVC